MRLALNPNTKRIAPGQSLAGNFKKRKLLYFMALPGILLYLVFRYLPMFGIVIAFQDFNPFVGVSAFWSSKFVGLHWFEFLFSQSKFMQLMANTLLLGIYGLVFAFPAPIVLALLFNEVRSSAFKKFSQTVTYIPHFLSWAIVGSIFIQMLSPNGGVINMLTGLFGMPPTYFLQDPRYARTIVVASGIWKEVGWDSILYLAAIAGIDLTLYEAAIVDGANRWKQTLHVTLPSIMPIVVICLILAVGRIMDTGFEQVYMFYNAMVESVLDNFDIYSYRIGIGNGQFSYITALGLFKNAVGLVLVLGANKVSKLVSNQGIW